MRAKKKLNVTSQRVAAYDGTKWVWELPKDRSALSPYKDRSLREMTTGFVEVPELDSIDSPVEEVEEEPVRDLDADRFEKVELQEDHVYETSDTFGGRQWHD